MVMIPCNRLQQEMQVYLATRLKAKVGSWPHALGVRFVQGVIYEVGGRVLS